MKRILTPPDSGPWHVALPVSTKFADEPKKETNVIDHLGALTRRMVVAVGFGAILATSHAPAINGATLDFPVKGRPITMIVPFAAGGPTDVGARLLVPFMEKELGTSIQVVNKPGATTQVGMTELTRAKPDGYTIAMVAPSGASMTYVDKERGAPYGRKDFVPIAGYTTDANLVIVPGNSPFKTTKELIDAARARPKQIKMGTSGLMSAAHLAGVALEEATGVRFAFVHFNGAAPETAAMLGGNLDAAITGILATLPHQKVGTMRVLGTIDDKETKFFPGVKPLKEQGFDVYSPVSFGLIAPGGTPNEIVELIAATVNKAMKDPELMKKLDEVGLAPGYRDPKDFAAFWDRTETSTTKLVQLAKQRQD